MGWLGTVEHPSAGVIRFELTKGWCPHVKKSTCAGMVASWSIHDYVVFQLTLIAVQPYGSTTFVSRRTGLTRLYDAGSVFSSKLPKPKPTT